MAKTSHPSIRRFLSDWPNPWTDCKLLITLQGIHDWYSLQFLMHLSHVQCKWYGHEYLDNQLIHNKGKKHKQIYLLMNLKFVTSCHAF